MIGTLESVMCPPARPSTAFFNDRVLASKIGKSTEARWTSMLTIVSSDPVGDAGTVVAQATSGRALPTTVMAPTTTQCLQL